MQDLTPALLSAFLCVASALVAVACGSPGSGRESAAVTSVLVYAKDAGRRSQAIWIADTDGRNGRRLVAGRSPSLSPDGSSVVFQGNCDERLPDDCPDLYIVRSGGGKPRLLSRQARSAVWSPDSTRVVARRGRSLLEINVGSGKTVELDRGIFFGWSFSPSGDSVAYARGASNAVLKANAAVFVVRSGGASRRRLTAGGSIFPVWGPKAIAFVRVKAASGWPAYELWRMDGEGRAARRLARPFANLPLGLVPVEWSADGRLLLAAHETEFSFVPYAVDPASGAVRKLGSYRNERATTFGLSRDGRWVLVQVGSDDPARQRIEQIAYATGRRRVIVPHAAEPSWNR